jgi:hypothetical protein
MDILQLLKQYGFKWYKDGTTDSVTADGIQDIIPAANGFTVVYTPDAAIKYSTVVVEQIELPENFDTTWIFVHWKSISDQYVGAPPIKTIPSSHVPAI